MSLSIRHIAWRHTNIRVRLGFALAMALAPFLIFSGVESTLNFQHEQRDQRAELMAAAERSAATARARIAAGEVMLQTLAPGSIGFQCVTRMAEIKGRIDGYVNLIRFDSIGRVACAAGNVPPDPGRRDRPWFSALRAGEPVTITSDTSGEYSDDPALLASVRAENNYGAFDGVLTAVISLSSLRPDKADRSVPADAEVALVDPQGHYLSSTSAAAFPASIGDHLQGKARTTSGLWFENDHAGRPRVFSSAPLIGKEVYVVMSSPTQGLLTWVWINWVSALVMPLIAFIAALIAVLLVAERGVVRWITYLRSLADTYAGGLYGVHPEQTSSAPPEIRDLAETLAAMAVTIAGREGMLKETLAHREDLMREIHHRVKNNLQVISSLLNMQQRALTDPVARAAMGDTRQRINALGLIYRSLYQGNDLRQVDLKDFLNELIAHLVVSDGAAAGPIRTELITDPLIIDPDQLAPLALFAVEAITNAKKRGLGAAGAYLGITFRVRDHQAELTITDAGWPEQGGGAQAVVEDGVGRTLMIAFARQLRGEVNFIANPDGGLTVRLVFPTTDMAAAA